MKLDIVPENLLEQLALWGGFVPKPIVEASWGMMSAQCLITASNLGVFQLLGDTSLTAKEIALHLKSDELGMETLLNALVGMNYLKKERDSYKCSKLCRKWLLSSSPNSMMDILPFFGDLWEQLSGLEKAIRTGKNRDLHHSGLPPAFWKRYMTALAKFAKMASREVLKKVSFDFKPLRLLDVGGGHGVYSMAFCRKYPSLKATILDLPEAAAIGKKLVDEEGLSQRISYRTGDFRQIEWGYDFDLVLLFNVIHNASPAESEKMIVDAHQALGEQGKLIIMDSAYKEDKKNHIPYASGLNEMFFFLVSGTRAYPESTIETWIQQAGFSRTERKNLLMAPATLFIASK